MAFVPDSGLLIDRADDNLEDRSQFDDTVLAPNGIATSPIVAPRFDVFDQLRRASSVDGSGSDDNSAIDIGAVERVDNRAPLARLTNPLDRFDAASTVGRDRDSTLSFVELTGTEPIRFFEVRLIDDAGTGIDPATVPASSVTLTQDGRTLTEGVQYTFGYAPASGQIRLTPAAGLFERDSIYEIVLDNSAAGIRDAAGTPVRETRRDGRTIFTIFGPEVTFDFGDAPASYDTSVGTAGPARHAIANTPLTLGATIDSESAPQPINRDDTVGIDDEDGVTTPLVFVEANGFLNVPIVINGTGFLTAWVDFDKDGEFDAAEATGPIAVTSATTQITIPIRDVSASDNDPGVNTFTTYARFRLAPNPVDEAIGTVVGGEVEDYVVTVEPTAIPVGPPTFNLAAGTFNFIEDVDSTQFLADRILPSRTPTQSADPSPARRVNRFTITEATPGSDPLGIVDLLTINYVTGASTATLSIDTTQDLVGSAVLVVRAEDSSMNPNRISDPQTITVNVQPVNDAPRVNPHPRPAKSPRCPAIPTRPTPSRPAATPTPTVLTIRSRSPTRCGKTTRRRPQADVGGFFIPVQPGTGPVFTPFQRIALLDVYTPGPANEIVSSPSMACLPAVRSGSR